MVVSAKLHSFTPQGLSQALWALSIFRYQPDSSFKRKVAARITQLLPSCNAIDIATFVYAYAALRMPPDQRVLERLQSSALDRMPSLLPSNLAKTIWAFAKIGAIYPALFLPPPRGLFLSDPCHSSQIFRPPNLG
jgi:hypothetical protein